MFEGFISLLRHATGRCCEADVLFRLFGADDLKAITKRLVLQAKRQGSGDNISIIVVFLKDPRAIAADNCLPMDLG